MRRILPYILGSLLLFSCGNSNAGKSATATKSAKPEKIREYRLEVVAEYPHDVTSYTQGLFFHEGDCTSLPVSMVVQH